MTNEDKVALSHAAFQQVSMTFYRCLKDNFSHVIPGSIISVQMLEAYREVVPKSARVYIRGFYEEQEES